MIGDGKRWAHYRSDVFHLSRGHGWTLCGLSTRYMGFEPSGDPVRRPCGRCERAVRFIEMQQQQPDLEEFKP